MIIKLKDISINSADIDLKNYEPKETNLFGLWINLYIGPANQDIENYFQVFVCSPEWLCKTTWQPELVRHTMILREYNLDEIIKTINKCIEECSCHTWEETANKLSRYFAWEFEDYIECDN